MLRCGLMIGNKVELERVECEESQEIFDEVKPMKSTKRAGPMRKTSLRVSESGTGRGDDGSAFRDNLMSGDRGIYDEELGAQDVNPLMDDYNPPNMQRL